MGAGDPVRGLLEERGRWLVKAAALGLVLGALGMAADRGLADSAATERTTGARRGEPLRIVWAGDIVLGSDAGAAPDDGRALFAHVTDQLRSADLAIGNLEGTLTQGGHSKCGGRPSVACFAFRAPPSTAVALRDAGFDVLSTANNHANDYGEQGQSDTRLALAAQGLAATGKPDEITVARARGRRVALVGFSTYPWSADLRDLAGVSALVTRARSSADIVVVLMHSGAEGSQATHVPLGRETAFGEDRGDTRAFAHAAIDAGADIVLGSGPHVLRGIERYRGRLIAYSLGDFAAWGVLPTSGVMGLTGLLEVDLSLDGRPLQGRFTSLRLKSPGIPVDDRTLEAARLVSRLGTEDFGDAAVVVDRYSRLVLRTNPAARSAGSVPPPPTSSSTGLS